MKRLVWVLLVFVLLLVSCNVRDVSLDEVFTLQKEERVQVSGEALTIQLDGVGREWDDQGEYVNVSLIVKTAGEEKKLLLYLDDDWQVGDYAIQLISANPFGDPTSCELLVTEP